MRSSCSWKTLFILLFFALSLQSSAQMGSEHDPAPVPNKSDAKPPQDISRWPGFLFAYEGGGGTSSTAYAGVKIGGAGVTLDFGYDRIPAHNGFSTEISGLLPLIMISTARTQ